MYTNQQPPAYNVHQEAYYQNEQPPVNYNAHQDAYYQNEQPPANYNVHPEAVYTNEQPPAYNVQHNIPYTNEQIPSPNIQPNIPQANEHSPSYTDTQNKPQETFNLSKMETYKNDESSNPASFIDKHKKLVLNLKDPKENDIPFDAEKHTPKLKLAHHFEVKQNSIEDELEEESVVTPIRISNRIPTNNEIPPDQRLLQNQLNESEVQNIEIPKELPKNNGFADDRPFQPDQLNESKEQRYMNHVQQNFEGAYMYNNINPHLDGRAYVDEEAQKVLEDISNQNKKCHSEIIIEQINHAKLMKLNQKPSPPLNEEKQAVHSDLPYQEIDNQISREHVDQNLIQRTKTGMEGLVRTDQPFHHSIGVTLNQINSFASKNTQILENRSQKANPKPVLQNESTSVFELIPSHIESVPVEIHSSTQIEKPIQSTNLFSSNYTSVKENLPREPVSFKKQTKPNTQRIHEVSQIETVKTSFPVSQAPYVSNSMQETHISSNISHTTKSSRMVGKYEVYINPETQNKRIVISSKPSKMSYRSSHKSNMTLHSMHVPKIVNSFNDRKVSYISNNDQTKEIRFSTTTQDFPQKNFPPQTMSTKEIIRKSIPLKPKRISITSNNIHSYTPSKPNVNRVYRSSIKKVAPSDTYNLNSGPKIIRVSHNQYVPSQKTNSYMTNTISRPSEPYKQIPYNNYKSSPYSKAIPAKQSYKPYRVGMQSIIKNEPLKVSNGLPFSSRANHISSGQEIKKSIVINRHSPWDKSNAKRVVLGHNTRTLKTMTNGNIHQSSTTAFKYDKLQTSTYDKGKHFTILTPNNITHYQTQN